MIDPGCAIIALQTLGEGGDVHSCRSSTERKNKTAVSRHVSPANSVRKTKQQLETEMAWHRKHSTHLLKQSAAHRCCCRFPFLGLHSVLQRCTQDDGANMGEKRFQAIDPPLGCRLEIGGNQATDALLQGGQALLHEVGAMSVTHVMERS